MTEKLDILLKPCLLKTLSFNLKKKSYKKGKLLFYKLCGNYLTFTLITEKKKETFEIPFPYSVSENNGNVILDYRLETLAESDFELLIALRSVTKVKNCKFYDTTLTISSL